MMKHWWVLLLAASSGRVRHRALFNYPGLSLTFGRDGVLVAHVDRHLGIYAGVMQRPRMPWGWTVAFGALSVVAGCLHCSRPRSRSPRSWTDRSVCARLRVAFVAARSAALGRAPVVPESSRRITGG